MTGEELYAEHGEPILGPWAEQAADVQRAWDDLAGGVTALAAAREAFDRHSGQPD